MRTVAASQWDASSDRPSRQARPEPSGFPKGSAGAGSSAVCWAGLAGASRRAVAGVSREIFFRGGRPTHCFPAAKVQRLRWRWLGRLSGSFPARGGRDEPRKLFSRRTDYTLLSRGLGPAFTLALALGKRSSMHSLPSVWVAVMAPPMRSVSSFAMDSPRPVESLPVSMV